MTEPHNFRLTAGLIASTFFRNIATFLLPLHVEIQQLSTTANWAITLEFVRKMYVRC